jgi:hypothetical protein
MATVIDWVVGWSFLGAGVIALIATGILWVLLRYQVVGSASKGRRNHLNDWELALRRNRWELAMALAAFFGCLIGLIGFMVLSVFGDLPYS